MAAKKKIEEVVADEETQVELAEANETDEATAEDIQEVEAAEAEMTDESVDQDITEGEESKPALSKAEGTTKAGKRSAKALREAEAETARQEAKAEVKEADAPKTAKRQQPNPLHQHGKKYRAAADQIDRTKLYGLAEALELVAKTASTKFDSSVEVHVNLGVDPRQADQMVRASVVLPHGTGKSIRVAVFAEGKAAEDAKAAGADLIGTDKLLADIDKGKLDFDMLIATPDKMATLGKAAKVLGPRGLMPNPKSGTVTLDVAKAVKEAKAGKIEFRIDKQAIIHQAVGKVSFKADAMLANVETVLKAIMKAKPSSTKGTYVKSISVTSSMGPGIKLDSAAVVAALSGKN